MKTIMLMSWRNMWRQKRRSLVVIASMAIGIWAMIISVAFMNGMMVQVVENIINTSLGHVAIHKKDYQQKKKLALNFRPTKEIMKKIKKIDTVVAYAPKVKIEAALRSAESQRVITIVGIEPEMEKKVSAIYTYTDKTLTSDTDKKLRSRFLKDPAASEILISKTLAEKLEKRLYDKVTMRLRDINGDSVEEALRIVGLYETPVDTFDQFYAFTGIKKLQQISGIKDNITEITIITENRNKVNDTKKALAKVLDLSQLEILSWRDLAPKLVKSIQTFDKMVLVFFAIIFITVVFSIINTLIMSIMERFHEIGVMKCIGTRPSHIFFMVIFESINLGAIGLATGVIAGALMVIVLGITGLDLSFMVEAMRTWKMGNIIYPSLSIIDIVKCAIVVFFTSIIAAIYPAVKAARIKPLEALHYV